MKALIVVDMQKDFIDGTLGTAEAQAIVDKVADKIAGYRKAGEPVFFTRDTHGENYPDTQEGRKLPVPHCIKGTEGWEIWPSLSTEDAVIVDKPTFGSWKLAEELAALDQQAPLEEIELVGLCTDICVISNAILLKARFPEIVVRVDGGCCAGVTPETHLQALKAMELCQIEIVG